MRNKGILIGPKLEQDEVFPQQSFYRNLYQGSGAKGYIGTWEREIALKIAAELKADGFCLKKRGRGPRKVLHNPETRTDCPVRTAPNIALYIVEPKR